MKWLLCSLWMACGGPAKATSAPAPTCRDAGIKLRSIDEVASATHAREVAITNACERGHWSPDVIHCVTTDDEPDDCLFKLDHGQRASYLDSLQTCEACGDDFRNSLEGDAENLGLFSDPVGPGYVGCDDVVTDAAPYPPALQIAGDDRDWLVAQRKIAIASQCQRDVWALDVKQCLHGATSDAATLACIAKLDAKQQASLATRLSELDELLAKTSALRTQPVDCDHVVAVYYGEAAWQHKLDAVEHAERERMIAASRIRMGKTCATDRWNVTLRACVVAGGGNDCFEPVGQGWTWSYPAVGVTLHTGVPQCDAYSVAMTKFLRCTQVAKPTRDAVLQMFEEDLGSWGSTPREDREARTCKVGGYKVEAAAKGCPQFE